MTLLPFYCDVSKFDGPTQKKLAENNVVMSFFKGEDSIFDNIQRIIYKKGTQCCVVYVGYTVNHVSFMIQVSEQYLKTVATFGNADLKNNEVFLNTTISEKRIPFFIKCLYEEAVNMMLIFIWNRHLLRCSVFKFLK